MTSTKTKPAAIVLVTTRAEADEQLGVLGRAYRSKAAIEVEMQKAMQEATARFSPRLEKITVLIEATERDLTDWCEGHRAELLEGESKTATIGVHQVQFRMKPPKVSLRDVEKVIENIKRLKFKNLFLRTKEEVNKEAMLAHPDKAERIPGVTVKRDEEEIVLSPFALDGVA